MNTFLTLLTGGGLVAAGAALSALVNNWLGSKRDERTRAHERQMAQEALGQERRERTYTELGIYLAHYADWAGSIRPLWGPIPAPPPMPPEERWRIQTLVMNHGSSEVRRLVEQLGEQVRKIEQADTTITAADSARGAEPELEERARQERLALEGYKKAMHETADAIRDQMRAELEGRTEPGTSLAVPPRRRMLRRRG
jgi:hypothetical protein